MRIMTVSGWKILYCGLLTITTVFIGQIVFADSILIDGNVGKAPLTIPSLSPGHLFRPNATAATPSYAPKESFVLYNSLTWGNIWNLNEEHYKIDGEWLLLTTKASYVLCDGVEIGASIPAIARTGGFADSLIEDFHDLFDLSNADREKYPNNEMTIEVNTPDGKKTSYQEKGWGLGDISLFSSWILTRGGRILPCTVIEAGITLPTGDEDKLLGIGDPVWGMAVLMTKRIGSSRWLVNLAASGSYCSRKRMLGIEINQEQYTLLSGLEYEWSPRLSIILQELMSSPFAKDFYELSESTNDLNLGMKFRVGKLGTMEISVQEDLLNFNNSADFGLHIGYRQIF